MIKHVQSRWLKRWGNVYVMAKIPSKSRQSTSETAMARDESSSVSVPSPPSLIHKFENGSLTLNHVLMEEAFGSKDHGFVNGLMSQVIQMSAVNGKVDRVTLDFIGGALLEMKPRNAMEAILVGQIIANHLLAMKFARLTITSEYMERTEKLEPMATKLMRTTTAQMEAFHKMRNGGKQRVTVEHVTVAQGGQAIIGNVERGGG